METKDRVKEISKDLGITLDEEGLEFYTNMLSGYGQAVSALQDVELAFSKSPYPRSEWSHPEPGENPHNAWYVKVVVEGAKQGPLKGKTVALEDNVMLEGVPVMNGSQILEGYIAKEDASIVTRLLDAGATITGKSTCEAYCMSCSSFFSDPLPVLNPISPERSAGGSSSGSAALVASGAVDFAIGCDQGGSIRMPSSYCGIVGMKPTHGLVPYTGILGHDPIIDHAGPMTRTVADNALVLETLAGPDGLDSRQMGARVTPYVASLDEGVKGLRIGIVKEGFEHPGCEEDVCRVVRQEAERLRELGAEVAEISIREHALASVYLNATLAPISDLVFMMEGFTPGQSDVVDPDFIEYQRKWRDKADQLPESAIAHILISEFIKREFGYAPMARSVHLVKQLRRAYDAALEQVDVLVMPTTPTKATPLPGPDASREELLSLAFTPSTNTRPFNYSHHPAMSLPCGLSDGLPVGMMLVGRAYEEATLYRAASAYESLGDWREY